MVRLITRVAFLSYLCAQQTNAFAPLQPGRVSTAVYATLAPVAPETLTDDEVKASPAEDMAEDVAGEMKVDISVPYDATVELAYAATDKSKSYDEFKVQYLANAVEEVKAKQPGYVDISVPYDATVQLAYETTDKSKPYDDFKIEYLANAVEEVKAKQPGYVAPKSDVSVPYEATVGAAYEASDKSKSYDEFKTEYLTKAVMEIRAKQMNADVVEEDVSVAEEETNDVSYYTRPDISQDQIETPKKRGEGVTYYQRPTLTQNQVYAWTYKEPGQSRVLSEQRKAREGEYTLKTNEVKAIYVKNLERPIMKEKPEKKKKRTAQEKKAIHKENLKARAGKVVLEKTKPKAVIEEKKDVIDSKDIKIDDKPIAVKVMESKAKEDNKTKAKKINSLKNDIKAKAKVEGVVEYPKISIEDVRKETADLLAAVKDGKDIEKMAKKMIEKKQPRINTDAVGLFAPAVLLTKDILGQTELNKLRAKIITIHSDVIGKFTETAQTEFGNQVLKVLFTLADKDGDGTIDEEELTTALNALGFDFLDEKQVAGMFRRADGDKNGRLDFEEWQKATPKALKSNLIKLAKKNGHDLGFLA